MNLIQEENNFRTMETLQDIKDEFAKDVFRTDDETQLYLEIKLEMTQAKEAILNKHGLSWKKFYDIEDNIKRTWSDVSPGIICMRDGYAAEGVVKDITLYKGNGQVIGKEISHISIRKTQPTK
jgi:hypothetical protein